MIYVGIDIAKLNHYKESGYTGAISLLHSRFSLFSCPPEECQFKFASFPKPLI
jgi:hypothetical protein